MCSRAASITHESSDTAYGPEAAKKVLDRLMTALGTEVVNSMRCKKPTRSN